MTPAELDTLADKVADRLREPMISAALPAEVGQLLRDNGPRTQLNMIPLQGASCLYAEWTVTPKGELVLRLSDAGGERFWQGTFEAVDRS